MANLSFEKNGIILVGYYRTEVGDKFIYDAIKKKRQY